MKAFGDLKDPFDRSGIAKKIEKLMVYCVRAVLESDGSKFLVIQILAYSKSLNDVSTYPLHQVGFSKSKSFSLTKD